jgi:hypothetical protein
MPVKLISWLLLPPMLMAGLWMVCSDAASPVPQESADCAMICAIKHKVNDRLVCFLLPDGKTSITVLDIGSAILPVAVALQPAATAEPVVIAGLVFYSNPTLAYPTPPPRA